MNWYLKFIEMMLDENMALGRVSLEHRGDLVERHLHEAAAADKLTCGHLRRVELSVPGRPVDLGWLQKPSITVEAGGADRKACER